MDSDFPGLTKTGGTPNGIPFTPPADSLDPNASEGEAMIRWAKGPNGYVITEIEGRPVESDPGEQMPADQEIDSMAGGY